MYLSIFLFRSLGTIILYYTIPNLSILTFDQFRRTTSKSTPRKNGSFFNDTAKRLTALCKNVAELVGVPGLPRSLRTSRFGPCASPRVPVLTSPSRPEFHALRFQGELPRSSPREFAVPLDIVSIPHYARFVKWCSE